MRSNWFAERLRVIPLEDHVKLVEKYVNGATLQELAKPYGVSRERIRQIIQRLLPVQAGQIKINIKKKREQKEEEEYHEIYYKKCKCGKEFHNGYGHNRREKKETLDLCGACFLKVRGKLYGYKWQKQWNKNHREQLRVIQNRAGRAYYARNKELCVERQKQWHIKRALGEI